jgi:membrane-associated phospholipid phosphatase
MAQQDGLERELPFLGIFWLVTTVYMLTTLKWKVSVHTGVLATLASLGLLLGGWAYSWLWLLVVIVAWARVIRRDHTWSQVMVGGLLPPVVVMAGVVLFT